MNIIHNDDHYPLLTALLLEYEFIKDDDIPTKIIGHHMITFTKRQNSVAFVLWDTVDDGESMWHYVSRKITTDESDAISWLRATLANLKQTITNT